MKPIAEFWRRAPKRVLPNEFSFSTLIQQCSNFEEATGEAGDVFLLHPYLLHASSLNPLRLPRLDNKSPDSPERAHVL
ncbi:MAG: hypothetical protein QM758_27190 [Armatimonas sp.]